MRWKRKRELLLLENWGGTSELMGYFMGDILQSAPSFPSYYYKLLSSTIYLSCRHDLFFFFFFFFFGNHVDMT